MLKKICRCGKVIPYNVKKCPKCEVKSEEERKQNIRYYKKLLMKEIVNIISSIKVKSGAG